MKKSISWT